MKRILSEIPASQRLIVGEDDAVVLRVALVTSFHRPIVRFLLLRCEASDIIGKHVQIRAVVYYPTC